MRIAKHAQSCFIIEQTDGGRVAIDAGAIGRGSYDFDPFGSLDAVLFTHRHSDHLDPSLVGTFVARDVALYGLIGSVEGLDPSTTLDQVIGLPHA